MLNVYPIFEGEMIKELSDNRLLMPALICSFLRKCV